MTTIGWARFGAVTVLFLIFSSCQSDVETVESRDDFGRLERFERRKKDFAKEGLYQRFHEDGHLMEEAHYKNDTLEGERRYLFPNGKVERVEQYKHGVMDGPYIQYYDNGQVELEQTFVQGVLQGISNRYYKTGKMMEKVTLRDNDENGPFTEWYENGNLKAEGAYLDGDNEHGVLKLYDTLGQLERLLDCQRGACHTTWERGKN